MKLKVLLPEGIFLDAEVSRVAAEAENGAFVILPRHVDWVTALVPGILSYDAGGEEAFLAVDEGVLVKCGPEVLVSTRNAVGGESLGRLRRTVDGTFRQIDERERKARSILARFEADFIRRFIEIERYD
ncbi:MAG TPA: F0F1 ATP synthase subunit epsilon [Candidatus Aminicenantes bacterium]|nr:F0F1 ATP synthase subunit epsilon [Candidatus Aminicenantes bacterium]